MAVFYFALCCSHDSLLFIRILIEYGLWKKESIINKVLTQRVYVLDFAIPKDLTSTDIYE